MKRLPTAAAAGIHQNGLKLGYREKNRTNNYVEAQQLQLRAYVLAYLNKNSADMNHEHLRLLVGWLVIQELNAVRYSEGVRNTTNRSRQHRERRNTSNANNEVVEQRGRDAAPNAPSLINSLALAPIRQNSNNSAPPNLSAQRWGEIATRIQTMRFAVAMHLVDIPALGDCQYDSLMRVMVWAGRAIISDGFNVHHMRRLLVQWLRSNKDYYMDNGARLAEFAASLHSASLRPTEGAGTADEVYDMYLERLIKEREYGDHLTLIAAANVFSVNIRILSYERQYDVDISPPLICTERVYIAHVSEHYKPVLPVNAASSVPPASDSINLQPSILGMVVRVRLQSPLAPPIANTSA